MVPKNGVQNGLRPFCTPFFGVSFIELHKSYQFNSPSLHNIPQNRKGQVCNVQGFHKVGNVIASRRKSAGGSQ